MILEDKAFCQIFQNFCEILQNFCEIKKNNIEIPQHSEKNLNLYAPPPSGAIRLTPSALRRVNLEFIRPKPIQADPSRSQFIFMSGT